MSGQAAGLGPRLDPCAPDPELVLGAPVPELVLVDARVEPGDVELVEGLGLGLGTGEVELGAVDPDEVESLLLEALIINTTATITKTTPQIHSAKIAPPVFLGFC